MPLPEEYLLLRVYAFSFPAEIRLALTKTIPRKTK
jgi:hypothetical protein